MSLKAIDPWVNVSMGDVAHLGFMKAVKKSYKDEEDHRKLFNALVNKRKKNI